MEQLEAMSMEQRDSSLLPVEASIQYLPQIALDEDSTYYLQRGQAVWKSGAVPAGALRLYGADGVFLGIGEQMPDGKIAPKRLVQIN